MYGCKCSCEIKISIKYILYVLFMVASALLIEECIVLKNGWPQLLSWNTVLWKLFPAINYKEKKIFRNNCSTLDHSLFLWVFTYYFTKNFVYMSVIAAVCYFSVYNLIGWGPSKHLLVHSQQQDTRKRSKLCPKLTVKK